MNKFKKIISNKYLLAFMLGAALTLAFPPFGVLPVVIIAFIGLLTLIEKARNRTKAFWLGWCFGFGHFMTSLYWFSHALLTDPERFGWMVPFSLTLIPAILGIYIGIVALLTFHFNTSKTLRVFAFISIWVFVEFLRTNFVIPFSWNLLGFALTSSDSLLQFASIGGLYGSSLLIAFIGSFFYTKNRKVIYCGILIACFIWGFGNYRLYNKSVAYYDAYKIRLVQPSILEHPMGDARKKRLALEKLVDLTVANRDEELKYIIWPEASFPYFMDGDEATIRKLASFAPNGGALIFGADRLIRSDAQVYNSIFAISNDAVVLATYDKKILVPFGEYVPFHRFLPFVDKVTDGATDFSRGAKSQEVLKIGHLPSVLPLICYEVIFPKLNIDNAQWMLNITNDAWFGNSIGPYQHFAMARFRAAEYSMPLVRVANNGITAVFSSYGDVIESLKTNEVGYIDIYLPKPIEKTLLMEFIYKILNNLVFVILFLAILVRIRQYAAK